MNDEININDPGTIERIEKCRFGKAVICRNGVLYGVQAAYIPSKWSNCVQVQSWGTRYLLEVENHEEAVKALNRIITSVTAAVDADIYLAD